MAQQLDARVEPHHPVGTDPLERGLVQFGVRAEPYHLAAAHRIRPDALQAGVRAEPHRLAAAPWCASSSCARRGVFCI